MEISNIKLIIWDLDDTFWSGTLSEEGITPIQCNIDLLFNSIDAGVMHSICSKNDKSMVELKLVELGINDVFVFKSINWESKGKRVSEIINRMALRPANVLFIDDNIQNLEEAKFYSPDITSVTPSYIPQLINYFKTAPKNDINHKRLKRYQLLELRSEESKNFSSNEEFLYSSNIQVEIRYDCLAQFDRVYELVQRTNQLNFTKLRHSEFQLKEALKCADEAGYIVVTDRFGDYGIVGFYLLKDRKLVHFLFSCRIIGQGIEQYVYSKLKYPELDVVGEVYNNINRLGAPKWINNEVEEYQQCESYTNKRILFKGPCNLSAVLTYIKGENIESEFTFTSERYNSVESHNHSTGILGLLYPQEVQNSLISDLIFMSEDIYKSKFWINDRYSFIVLSTLPESGLGIYKRKSDGVRFAFGECNYPLTEKSNWSAYINGEIFTSGNKFDIEFLDSFSKEYEFVGKTSVFDYLSFLDLFFNKNKKTHLVLLLGVEVPYKQNKAPSYRNRDAEHKLFNNGIKEYAKGQPRLHLINITDFIDSQKDFTNNINHYTPRVYYAIAQKLLVLHSDIFDTEIELVDKKYLVIDRVRNYIKLKIQVRYDSLLYKMLRKIYRTIR